MNNREILVTAMGMHGKPIKAGMTYLVIWRDEQHLNEWKEVKDKSTNVSILEVQSSLLPTMVPEGTDEPSQVAMIAIDFSSKPDRSDLHVPYYITVKPK